MTDATLPNAVRQDGHYPRPQLVRAGWQDLTGPWEFAFGTAADADEQPGSVSFDRVITVPFPPESPASGIGDTGYHPVVWYRRAFTHSELMAAGLSETRNRTILHFGAVDFVADVWLNGAYVGHHEGGQTPFEFDITPHLHSDEPNVIIVRAIDDPLDVEVPRGKQDWQEQPHSIWYHRTTGIWQPVWLECVPPLHITAVAWQSDLPRAEVELELTLSRRPPAGTRATLRIDYDGELLAETSWKLLDTSSHVRASLPSQRNGQHYEHLLWSPQHPRLLNATISIDSDSDSGGDSDSASDTVASYLGLRSVAASGGRLLLNDRPIYLRAVLAQNYWPESHLAARSPEALRREVELILALGFNTARVHQKAEDPRFLYWADRLGLMIWGETASAYEFSPRAVRNQTREWLDIVLRDRSHPSVIAWVPLNESWGVQHIAHDPRQRAFSRAIADLTRALDGTRPVMSNDGWEHTDSDLMTVHDYDNDPVSLRERYASKDRVSGLLAGIGPAGRRMTLQASDQQKPVLLTEFGGISWTATPVKDSWGYATARNVDEFALQLAEVVGAVVASPVLAGFCYTQLTDTGQETNGLTSADRSPKLPVEQLRAIFGG